MAFDLRIHTGSSTPIFRQIVDQVRLASATGRLAPGDPLPSVRALAERLLVNPNTIAKAYAELARDRIIETHQGKGVFVAEQARDVYTLAERQRRLSPAVDALAREALALGFSLEQVQEMLGKRLRQLGKEEG